MKHKEYSDGAGFRLVFHVTNAGVSSIHVLNPNGESLLYEEYPYSYQRVEAERRVAGMVAFGRLTEEAEQAV